MATGTFNPAVDGDDIGMYEDAGFWTSLGSFPDWYCGNPFGDVHSGMRFNSTGIPQGATIVSATLDIAGVSNNGTSPYFTIYGINQDAPAAFSLSNDPVNELAADRSTATATATSSNYTSIDVSSIVQEVVNRGGFNGTIQLTMISLGNGYLYRSGSTLTNFDLNVEWSTAGPIFSGPIPDQSKLPSTAIDTITLSTYFTEGATSSGGITYALNGSSDALPTGVTLSSGVISGTPSVTGTFNIIVDATDDDATTSSNSFEIFIGTPPDFPQWVDDSSHTLPSNGVITLPPDAEADDFVLTFVGTDAGPVEMPSSGWTDLAFSGGTYSDLDGWYRFLTDTTNPSATSVDTGAAVISLALSGVDTDTPIDTFSSTQDGSAVSSITFPTVTVAEDGSLAVLIAVLDDDASTVTSWPSGSDATHRIEQQGTGSDTCTLAVCIEEVDAGSYSPGSITFSSSDGIYAATLIIKGAPASSSEDALLADDIASGTPTVGTPSIGQEHALSGDDVTAGTPTLSTPALAEVSTEDALLADDISAGTPTVGTPSLGQEHALLADDVAAGTPTVSAPTIGQEHNLLADDLASGAPIVTSPSLAQAHVLLAEDIVSGTPVVTEPSVGQSNVLLADDIAAGTPSVTTPEIGQVHALSGNDITSGTPTVSTPALSTDGTDGLSAEDISAGVPTVSAPTIGQVHALLGDDISSGTPTVSEPGLSSGVEQEQEIIFEGDGKPNKSAEKREKAERKRREDLTRIVRQAFEDVHNPQVESAQELEAPVVAGKQQELIAYVEEEAKQVGIHPKRAEIEQLIAQMEQESAVRLAAHAQQLQDEEDAIIALLLVA